MINQIHVEQTCQVCHNCQNHWRMKRNNSIKIGVMSLNLTDLYISKYEEILQKLFKVIYLPINDGITIYCVSNNVYIIPLRLCINTRMSK